MMCQEHDFQLFEVKTSQLIGTGFFGDLERNIEETFDKAVSACQTGKTVVLFFDELDCSLGVNRGTNRHGFTSVLKSGLAELLKKLDQVKVTEPRLIVAAASNRPQDLDPALRRRFGRPVEFQLPTTLSRAKFLGNRLGDDFERLNHQKLIDIVEKSDGLNYSELENFVEQRMTLPKTLKRPSQKMF